MSTLEQTATDVIKFSTVVLNDEPKQDQPQPAAYELRSIEAKRIEWEEGVYRTSNAALYEVLAQCLSYCGEVSHSIAKLRNAALMTFYRERGYRYNEDQPLVTRVVRAVFGGVNRRRISAYSLVLRQAQKEDVPYTRLAAWIEERGGIQEIRLSRSATFISPAKKVSIGKEYFEEKPDLGVVQSDWLSAEAGAKHMNEACVLLAKQQPSGAFTVHAVLRSPTVVKAAFSALYSKQRDALAQAKAEVDAANDADGAISKQA